MVAAFAGHKNLSFEKVEDEAAMKKDKALEGKHPSLTLPYLATSGGDVVSTNTGIMGYLGRSNAGANLYGKTVFEQGKVEEWIAWSECISP